MITAVFADLVGSTALGERLDPEELKLVVGEAVVRVIGAVESFGGTIKDLAGDGVLALFGAPTAHEDDPERAVRAALRIREELHRYAGEVEQAWGVTGASHSPVIALARCRRRASWSWVWVPSARVRSRSAHMCTIRWRAISLRSVVPGPTARGPRVRRV